MEFASFYSDLIKKDLKTPKRIQEWKDTCNKILKENPELMAEKHLQEIAKKVSGFGTVGAIGTDGTTLIAATSTGGRPCKMPGRVGDSAIIGAGTIATKHIGVSCTGKGELAWIREPSGIK